MKKHLLVAVLILAVITSLSAGTLANYHTEIPLDGNVHSKNFTITADEAVSYSEAVAIIPGSTVVYKYNVVQATEVPVNYTFDTDLDAGNLKDLLTLSVQRLNTSGTVLGTYTLDSEGKCTVPNVSKDETGCTFKLTLIWDKGTDEQDIAASNEDVDLGVRIIADCAESPTTVGA